MQSLAGKSVACHPHFNRSANQKMLPRSNRTDMASRDLLIGLLIYRHGLRLSEACDLRLGRHRPNKTHHHCPYRNAAYALVLNLLRILGRVILNLLGFPVE